MMDRPRAVGRRVARSATTRRRIVEAAATLHREVDPSATSRRAALVLGDLYGRYEGDAVMLANMPRDAGTDPAVAEVMAPMAEMLALVDAAETGARPCSGERT